MRILRFGFVALIVGVFASGALVSFDSLADDAERSGCTGMVMTPEPPPVDQCPEDPDKTEPGICGCGVSDEDSDGDGVPDCNDVCPGLPDQDGCATLSSMCELSNQQGQDLGAFSISFSVSGTMLTIAVANTGPNGITDFNFNNSTIATIAGLGVTGLNDNTGWNIDIAPTMACDGFGKYGFQIEGGLIGPGETGIFTMTMNVTTPETNFTTPPTGANLGPPPPMCPPNSSCLVCFDVTNAFCAIPAP